MLLASSVSGLFKRRQFEPEVTASGGWLVSAFFLVVPGRRGVARRARSARRCNISTTFWNRIIGRSSAGYAQASIFARSGELGARSPATKRSIAPAARGGLLHCFILGLFS